MTRLFKYLILVLLFIAVPSNAGRLDYLKGAGSQPSPTDYTKDPACVFAAYMNSLGDAAEIDRSANSNDLTESAGDTIVRSSTVPSGFSGYSKDVERYDTEHLYHADGLATDLNGADQELTLFVRFKAESAPSLMHIVSKWDNVNGSRQYGLIYDQSNSHFLGLLSADGTNTTYCSGVTDISIGTWQSLALVYNDTDVRLYVNGVLDENGSDNPVAHTTGIYDGDQPFRIGAENGEFHFDGLYAELIELNRACYASEILEMHTWGITGTRGGND